MEPTSAQEWLEVANERAQDAEGLFEKRPESVGSVYLAGYAIECSLKGYLQTLGRRIPRDPQTGHNLAGLWSASGFRLSDVGDRDGSRAFFIQRWGTYLRYEAELTTEGLPAQTLLAGAKSLTGWIQTRVRRSASRRRGAAQ